MVALSATPGAASASAIVYLNRDGGRYTGAPTDDATLDQSATVQSLGLMAVDVPAYAGDDASWARLLECMRGIYADFDVEVTDVDPGATPHAEGVIGGGAESLGLTNDIAGIAFQQCGGVFSGVAFVFPENPAVHDQTLCEVAAMETAHSFGLDHELSCPDAMSYLRDCPDAKTFTDQDAPCGEGFARPCACGGETQNSYRHLLEVLGPRPANTAPAVSITSPQDGAEVAPGFEVSVPVTDEGAVARVELSIDGALVDTADDEPWVLVAPAALALGPHTVEARAFDDVGAEGSAVIAVEVSEEGTDPCVDGPCSGGGTSGCVAAVAGEQSSWGWVLAIAMLAAARRR